MKPDEVTVEDRIIARPIDSYIDFQARLATDGLNAPFPEFKPVVDFLMQELHSEHFQKILEAHPDLRLELNEALTFLTHVNITFTNTAGEAYPYEIPFDHPFPYRPTIDAIESALRLLDKLNRLEPNNKAVKLYHFDRYCYHRHALVASGEVVLIPTLKELSLTDFIRTRSVPIEFIGVISKTTRADGHQQSPLDFWYHDLNHARRLYAYIRRREKMRGIATDAQRLAYFQEVDAYITGTIFPRIIDVPPNASEEDRALHQIATMVIFEIVHETALTLEKDEIVRDMLRGNGPQPFEFMLDAGRAREGVDIESLRTPTGNIESGASIVAPKSSEPIAVNYFLDPTSVGLLTNVFGKLNHLYYDDGGVLNENLVPARFRTPESIVQAAKLIFHAIGFADYPSDEELVNLVLNREGTKERSFTKPVLAGDAERVQSATDPISAEEVIAQIKDLGKKVYTLFGYSALEYENKQEVLANIQAALEKLDPKEWVVNIGCTEDGIGAAYEIAHTLGLQTIGIVSTQALSYSGKFSPFVETIYIVNDPHWGGYVPGTTTFAETTKAYLAVSDVIDAYGGGENTAVILREGKKKVIPLSYTPADMDHEKAERAAQGKPVDFRGAAFMAWEDLKALRSL